MKKNENGAALVIALIVLMFFMAVSMNMFYIAQKKAERAGDKVVGAKATTRLDTGSNIGYFELRTASRYVAGNLSTIVGGVSFPDSEGIYESPNNSSYIRLNAFHEFFNSNEIGTNSTNLSSATSINLSSDVVKNWGDNSKYSLGGYRIVANTTQYSNIPSGVPTYGSISITTYAAIQPITLTSLAIPESFKGNGSKVFSMYTEYKKRIKINPINNFSGRITPVKYTLIYKECIQTTDSAITTGGTILSINGDSQGSMIVVRPE
jgi:hypothetical protein